MATPPRPPGIPASKWANPAFRSVYLETHSVTGPYGPGKGGPNPGHNGGHTGTRPDDRPGPRGAGNTFIDPAQRKANLHGLSTIQVQRLLKAHGYHVGVDGKMGPRTSSAIDAYVNGKSPNQYNTWAQRHFAPKAPTGAAAGAAAVGAAAGKGGGGGSGNKGGGGGPGSLGGLGGLATSLLAQAGDVGTMIPASTANDIAGMQYDANIADAQHALDMLPNQTAQNVHDIQRDYGAVLDAQDAARTADAATGKAGVASLGDAVKAIVSSLGGGANAGSAQTAAEGADQAGALAAIANAQDSYNNLIRPLLQDEAAGQVTSERARGESTRTNLMNTLANLKTGRGQAQSAALADIIGKNNDLAQTRFGNRASLINTIGSLEIGQSNAQTKALNAQIAKAKLNKGTTLSPSQLRGVSGQALQQFLDQNGHIDQGLLSKTGVQGIVKAVNNQYLAAGLDLGNPQVATSAMGVLRQLGLTPDPRWYGLG